MFGIDSQDMRSREHADRCVASLPDRAGGAARARGGAVPRARAVRDVRRREHRPLAAAGSNVCLPSCMFNLSVTACV